MKEPAGNRGKAAVALREAAIAFGAYVNDTSADGHDRAGGKRNRTLLAAALNYARLEGPLTTRAAAVLGEIDDKLTDGSLLDEGALEYLAVNVRPFVCELLGHRPRCGSTSQCRRRKTS